jgi:hypothetical protein
MPLRHCVCVWGGGGLSGFSRSLGRPPEVELTCSVDQKGAFVNVGGKSPAYLPALEYSASKITDVSLHTQIVLMSSARILQTR